MAKKGCDSASDCGLVRQLVASRHICLGFAGIRWAALMVIMVNADRILLDSNVAPGPDYRLYLTPKYVETGP